MNSIENNEDLKNLQPAAAGSEDTQKTIAPPNEGGALADASIKTEERKEKDQQHITEVPEESKALLDLLESVKALPQSCEAQVAFDAWHNKIISSSVGE